MGHVKDYSEETASKIDEEVHSIITKAYGVSEKLLNSNMAKLHEVAGYLMKHEKMSGEDFAAMMDGTFVETPEAAEAEEGNTEN